MIISTILKVFGNSTHFWFWRIKRLGKQRKEQSAFNFFFKKGYLPETFRKHQEEIEDATQITSGKKYPWSYITMFPGERQNHYLQISNLQNPGELLE